MRRITQPVLAVLGAESDPLWPRFGETHRLLLRRFYELLTRAGLPRIRFHDLRHTAATLMLAQGVHAKIVAERLGHSTPMLTLTVYSHVTPTMQREAADALDAMLGAR